MQKDLIEIFKNI